MAAESAADTAAARAESAEHLAALADERVDHRFKGLLPTPTA